MIAESDALKAGTGPPRAEPQGTPRPPASSASSAVSLPFPRDLLIHAARMRARGVSWGTIAARTPHTALELARLPFDHPEIWEPLYERAEKLALQEAEGEGLKALGVLLEGEDANAAEKAARELLVHRRHIERRRHQPQRHRDTEGDERLSAAGAAGNTGILVRDLDPISVPQCLCGEKEIPEELRGSIIQLACCRAQGEDLLSTAAEIGRPHEEVARWPFIYAKTWDRCWPTARLETARFYAARAIRKLTDLAFDPDRNLAARAARTLLVHRRHMHWNIENQPPRRQEGQEHRETKDYEALNAAQVSRNTGEPVRDPSSLGALAVEGLSVPWRLGGEKSCRSRDGP